MLQFLEAGHSLCLLELAVKPFNVVINSIHHGSMTKRNLKRAAGLEAENFLVCLHLQGSSERAAVSGGGELPCLLEFAVKPFEVVINSVHCGSTRKQNLKHAALLEVRNSPCLLHLLPTPVSWICADLCWGTFYFQAKHGKCFVKHYKVMVKHRQMCASV